MAAVITSRSRNRQPTGAVEINWSNPLTRSLGFLWNAADPLTEAVSRVVGSESGITPKDSTAGIGRTYSGADSGVEFGARKILDCSGAYSLFALGSPISSAKHAQFVSIRSAAGNIVCAFGANADGVDASNAGTFELLEYASSYSIYPASGTSWVDGNSHQFGVVRPAANSGGKVYYDGRSISATENAAGHQASDGNEHSRIGNLAGYSGTTYANDGPLLLVAGWTRAVEAAEFAALYDNPWQLFRPRMRRLYFGVTAAGGNTIAVPKGSLVLTTKVPVVTATDNKTIAVPKGALTLTTKAPTVTATQNNTISVPVATLRLTALAPTILGAEPIRRSTAAGSARGAGKKRRKFVELDGQLVEVRSAKEAVAKIQAFAEKVKTEVQTKVATAVVKAVQRGEVAEIVPPEIAVSDTLQQAVPQIEAIQQQINRAYEQAFIAMQQALEEDDEEAIFVLTH